MSTPPATEHVRLSLNENPFGPSPRVLDAISSSLMDLSCYAGEDVARLKAALSAEHEIAPEQIVLGEVLNTFGLYLAAQDGPGREFLYSAPGYTALVDAVRPAGGKAIAIPLDDRLGNDLRAFLRRTTAETRAVYLVNPHNPTGIAEDSEHFLDVVAELSQRTLVLVDEAYLDFLPDARERSTARLLREGARVVVFRTFAKLHGLAGLGLGYALAPPDLSKAMREIGVGEFFTLNRLGLVAANASLNDRAFLDAMRSNIKAERDAWHALFERLGVRYTDSQANFVFFDAGRPHQVVASRLASRGIDVGRAHPPLDNWVRISIGIARHNEFARQAVAEVLRDR